MTSQYEDVRREWYASARSSARYIGNKKILQAIKESVEKPQKKPVVYYIEADGGVGKTRILEEVLILLQPDGKWHQLEALAPEYVLDFYHLDSHTILGFLNLLYIQLKRIGVSFPKFEKIRDEHDEAIIALGPAIRKVKQLQSDMRTAFIEDLNASPKKIVLALDTTEHLSFERSVLQTVGLEEHEDTMAGWLIPGFLSKLENTVVLIAGRPNEGLAEDLEHAGKSRSIHLKTKPELKLFELEDSLEYFNSIIEATEVDSDILAERIRQIPDKYRRAAHFITDGHPLYLALIIDAMAVQDDIPSCLMNLGPQDFETLEKDSDEAKELKRRLREEILDDLRKVRQHLGQLLNLLALAKRGLGKEMLAWYNVYGKPEEEDIAQAEGELNVLLENIKLSVIKVRDLSKHVLGTQEDGQSLLKDLDDKLFFLQDVAAEHFEKRYETDQRERSKALEIILKFYSFKIKKLEERIGSLHDKRGKFTRDLERQDRRKSDEYKKVVAELRLLQDQLHRHRVEEIYYKFKRDAFDGFLAFREYAEDAFRNNDPERWLPARDILLAFSKDWFGGDFQKEYEGMTLSDIYAEVSMLRITFHLAKGEPQRALEIIENWRILPEAKDIMEDPFAKAASLYLEIYALIYQPHTLSEAEKLLPKLEKKIQNLSDDQPFDKWRKQLLEAHYYNIRGYFHRSKGQYDTATVWYPKSVKLWRTLEVETEHANSLNNWALALMEKGKHADARRICMDGLELRQQLGSSTAVAFSWNTLGIIDTRSGKPGDAIMNIKRAMSIFAERGQDRGLGLAMHAASEAHRRYASVAGGFLLEDQLEYLLEALEYAVGAVQLMEELGESFRLPEALIELGCVYRELVRVLPKSDEKREEYYQESEKALMRSEKLASETGFYYRAADAAVNRGWLYFFYGDLQKAEDLLSAKNEKIVKEYVPEEYLIFRGEGPGEAEDPVSWYWVQLGKADLLLGRIEMAKYREALENEDTQLAEEHLAEAARMWTLAMAYDLRYAPAFRDFENGKQAIYYEMKGLNDEELDIILEATKETIEEYCLPEKLGRLGFYSFIIDQFGLGEI